MANVLVIDDSVHIRDLIRTVLELAGHSVTVACDGLAGMTRFRSSGPDVVITDILMPDQDGLETIRQMRQTSPAVKIIAISGSGSAIEENFPACATTSGADLALHKPVRPKDLTSAVAALLERARSGASAR